MQPQILVELDSCLYTFIPMDYFVVL